MIYIITALKAEAQAFIDKYKLGNSKSNKVLTLNISGIGREKMYRCTQEVLSIMNSDDIIVNVGVCGASTNFSIGSIIENKYLTCVDEPIDDAKHYQAVDMESAGFLLATHDAKHTNKKAYMFKIVSDHFEPYRLTKDTTKKLIFDKIDEMMEIING